MNLDEPLGLGLPLTTIDMSMLMTEDIINNIGGSADIKTDYAGKTSRLFSCFKKYFKSFSNYNIYIH